MELPDYDTDSDDLAPAPPRRDPVWSDLSRRVVRLSAMARVQANAHAVPALANLLMQGLVL